MKGLAGGVDDGSYAQPAPLPLLPWGADEIAKGVGLLAGEDGGLVTVYGLATFAWDRRG